MVVHFPFFLDRRYVLTFFRAKESDILLVTIDAYTCQDVYSEACAVLAECDHREDARIIIVCNKCDLVENRMRDHSLPWPLVYTSCLSGVGLDKLASCLTKLICTLC